MGVAWGLCAPLAVGASIFRNMNFLKNRDPLWFKLHMYLNIAVVSLTCLGFLIAIGATNKEGGQTHFTGTTHEKVGLTVTLFVLVQCLAGIFRPSAIKKKKKFTVKETSEKQGKTLSGDGSDSTPKEEGFEVEVLNITAVTEDDEVVQDDINSRSDNDSWSFLAPPPPPTSPPPEEEQGDDNAPRSSDSTIGEEEGHQGGFDNTTTATTQQENDKQEKHKRLNSHKKAEKIRTYWKYGHRTMGVILFGLAWYNCHSGIVLFSEKYNPDNEQHLLNIFWGITGTILVCFLVKGYILRD